MCSLNGDDEEFKKNCIPFEKVSLSTLSKCRGCTNKALVVLRQKDAFCKDCFLSATTHKFRAALGKSKMIKPQDNVLVAFSGSQSSLALLHLLHSGLSEKHHKRFLFKVCVLFIDDGAIFNVPLDERIKVIEQIKAIVERYNFPFYFCTLNQVLSIENSFDLKSSFPCDNLGTSDKVLRDLFDNFKSISSKEDLLYYLKKKLILKSAVTLNCSKILTAEVANDLAIRLFTLFSLGRGDQASYETGFCDNRAPESTILRPLKDFLIKEVVFYNRFNKIDSFITRPSFTTKLHSSASIQKLTEKFINNLQDEFPSTVYTIFRTGEKLGINPNDKPKSNSSICLLCNSENKANANADFNAVQALNYSKQISERSEKVCKHNCCGSCLNQDNEKINNINFQRFLCYGCLSLVNDVTNVDHLSKNIIQSAVQRTKIEKMKEEIAEFLIDD